MKKWLLGGVIGMIALPIVGANAIQCSFESCDGETLAPLLLGCSSAKLLGCLHGEQVGSCTKCRGGAGYTLTTKTVQDPVYACTYTYSVCEKPCAKCADCTSDADWSAGNDGYEQKTIASCDTELCMCNKTSQYRCASGYFGASSNGTSGCTRCPENGLSDADTAAITSCYMSAGTIESDTTGEFTYMQNCYYSN